MTKQTTLFCAAAVVSLLVGCGGGGGRPAVLQPQALEGVFVDSVVMGLAYRTATRSGVTDVNGTFQYLPGEIVSFSLGAIELGSALGGSEVTPLDLLDLESIDDADASQAAHLTNILVFLQSFDADRNPANGIDLADLNQSMSSESLDFETDTASFRRGALLRVLVSHEGRLVEQNDALAHFIGSVAATISVRQPVSIDVDYFGDGTADIQTAVEYGANGLVVRAVTTGLAPFSVSEDLFQYDGENRLISTTNNQNVDGADNSGAFSPKIFSYEYAELGSLSSKSLAVGDLLVEWNYSYDEFGRISIIEKQSPSFETLPDLGSWVIAGRSRPVIFGSLVPPELALENFSLSTREVVGNYLESAEFTYSSDGHIEQVLYQKHLLREGETDMALQEQDMRQFDSAARLVSSVFQRFDGLEPSDEIRSEYTFSTAGLMETCTAYLNDELVAENSDPEISNEAQFERYEYGGSCPFMIKIAYSLSDVGRILLSEQTVFGLPTPPPDTLPERLVFTTTQTYEYENDDLTSVTVTNNEGQISGLIEFLPSSVVSTTFDPEGGVMTKVTTVTELFELSSPLPQYPFPIGSAAIIGGSIGPDGSIDTVTWLQPSTQ